MLERLNPFGKNDAVFFKKPTRADFNFYTFKLGFVMRRDEMATDTDVFIEAFNWTKQNT
jgi:hypothetical protein